MGSAAATPPAALDRIYRHVWAEGRAADAESLRGVARELGIDDLDAARAREEVKSQQRANFEAAIADGVFGVPSIVANGEVFWGNDATPMFEAWLDDPALFDTPQMRALRTLPEGVKRP